MKDKLRELLLTDVVCSTGDTGECDSCEHCHSENSCWVRMADVLADFLISRGVTVLPVKPGDPVYTIHRGKIKEWKVYFIGLNSLGEFTFNIADAELQNSRSVWDKEIGDTVFITEEDAINELKERKANEKPKMS